MKRDQQDLARNAETLLRGVHRKFGTPGLVVLCLLALAYVFAEPWLEARLGVDLPGIHVPVIVEEVPSTPSPVPEKQPSEPDARSPTVSAGDTVESLIRGDREVYVSPAGLRYTRGSQQGHRLRHLMAHAYDKPDRPVHGVFDASGASQVVAIVDEAYEQALSGTRTKKRTEGDRTIYVVDLGRRIGYVGGKSGARRHHPPTSYVQLVIIEDRLITAFPYTP